MPSFQYSLYAGVKDKRPDIQGLFDGEAGHVHDLALSACANVE